MAKFTVNGRAVTVENNQKLLRYLRDTLHLTSVKDGCSEAPAHLYSADRPVSPPRHASPRPISWRASPSSRWRG